MQSSLQFQPDPDLFAAYAWLADSEEPHPEAFWHPPTRAMTDRHPASMKNAIDCRNRAMLSFATELVHKAMSSSCYVKLPDIFVYPAGMTAVATSLAATIIRQTRSLLGLTNIIYRCDTFDAPDASRDIPWFGDVQASRCPHSTMEFDDAVGCYAGWCLTEPGAPTIHVTETDYRRIDPNEYGFACGGLKIADACVQQMQSADAITASIFTALRTHRADFSVCANINDVVSTLTRFISAHGKYCEVPRDIRYGIMQRLESRRFHIENAEKAFDNLRMSVFQQVELRRRSNESFLQDTCDDCLGLIFSFLEPYAASRLMCTNRAFSNMQTLRERRPHFRLREVEGTLPHRWVTASRDRKDIENGLDKPCRMGFVIANKSIRIYVDWGYWTPRKTPLRIVAHQKQSRETVYETPPEVAQLRPPEPSPDAIRAQQSAGTLPQHVDVGRMIRSATRRLKDWTLLEGPQPTVHPEMFFYRERFPICSKTGFLFRPSLVYADTHQVVSSPTFPTGLWQEHSLRKNEGTFKEARMDHARFLPASCNVHVPPVNTSSKHGKRQFKICVHVTGPNRYEFKLFSCAFEVVSQLHVIENAQKRKMPNDKASNKATKTTHP